MIPDFRNLYSCDDLYQSFTSAAEFIMGGYALQIGPDSRPLIQITSLELYMHSEYWPDPNTDRNSEQLKSGTWYVRRRGTNANTSRIDITAGSKANNIHCGMLIRGINYLDGSGKALKSIIRGDFKDGSARSWTAEEVGLLNTIHGCSVTDAPLKLVTRTSSLNFVFRYAQRKGLRYPDKPWNGNFRVIAEPQS